MTEITETGERIKLKAHDLFMQYGLRSVSMDDIANALGISKKTIYQSYADKDALVDDVILSVITNNQLCCEADRKASVNAIHEVFLAMDFMMQIFRCMNPALVFDMQKYYPGAYERFKKHKNEYLYGVIRNNILRGIQEEFYRQDLEVDLLARYRVESMMMPFNPEFQATVKLNLAAIEEELTLHFLYGIVSPKGYKLAAKHHLERIKKLKGDEK